MLGFWLNAAFLAVGAAALAILAVGVLIAAGGIGFLATRVRSG
ncbi:hypothetical protein [Paracoccus shandongensis]|nr:hypothetical protein [Paracoccus shandongensis]